MPDSPLEMSDEGRAAENTGARIIDPAELEERSSPMLDSKQRHSLTHRQAPSSQTASTIDSSPIRPQAVESGGPKHEVPQGIEAPQRRLWLPTLIGRQVGDTKKSFLRALRAQPGGIHYIKSNERFCAFYIDRTEFYRLDFMPDVIKPSRNGSKIWTEIGQGWVHPAALRLMGFEYVDGIAGHFAIEEDLAFVRDTLCLSQFLCEADDFPEYY